MKGFETHKGRKVNLRYIKLCSCISEMLRAVAGHLRFIAHLRIWHPMTLNNTLLVLYPFVAICFVNNNNQIFTTFLLVSPDDILKSSPAVHLQSLFITRNKSKSIEICGVCTKQNKVLTTTISRMKTIFLFVLPASSCPQIYFVVVPTRQPPTSIHNQSWRL